MARSALIVFVFIGISFGAANVATAQAPPPPPPPLWDVQLGGSFVGTNGNSDTSSAGADFALNRRWPSWQIESTASAVRTSDHGNRTAERYLGTFRGKRKITSIVSVSAGERAERDQFAGLDFRSVLDGGLAWALVRSPRWSFDALTSAAWNHESRVVGPKLDRPIGVFQALSKIPFGTGADTTQRFTYFPDFKVSSAYRSEAEVTAQASMTNRLALKVGYLWRYAHEPVTGFKKSDNTTTASVVLRWRATTPAP